MARPLPKEKNRRLIIIREGKPQGEDSPQHAQETSILYFFALMSISAFLHFFSQCRNAEMLINALNQLQKPI